MEPNTEGPAKRRRRGSPQLLIGVVVLAGGFYALVSSAGVEPYFLDVDEVARARFEPERPLRLKGDAVVGSYTQTGNSHRFQIKGERAVVSVRYDGNRLPDTFQMAMTGGREIVAEGRLDAQGVLVATEIVAKCPSKYEDGKVPEHFKNQRPDG